MNSEDCLRCRDAFMKLPVLQAEIRHEAAKHGYEAAAAMLRERMEEEHTNHS